ncbi:MAG: FeoA family protein [Galactobacillus timonensis]|jgi:ferrous iron transport protein A|uniref:FeoA family protein n=1 Tax=Galactobacillus timonensis TaxID=2041840 RepID=UPI000C815605|nr:FeoA family protein [Galactobacillus timonensis]MDY5221995.1 FeoA family protein [Lachnospiraceae bacterium]MDY6282521.1 FeoA family protein [Erysipelotrichaceae bacterium]MCI6067034.1 ferrous iron transport protein A [Galactobacillus timonensis]MCI6754411.1 ferrous iron transport protein A [Galactobacillus timonensis]MDD5852395.1 FeoA family protein [Galactobacillus timonensis]
MIPLTFADADSTVTVNQVHGTDEMKRHLEDLGFVPGTKVQVILQRYGDVIVIVKDTRLAITSQMASKVMVE